MASKPSFVAESTMSSSLNKNEEEIHDQTKETGLQNVSLSSILKHYGPPSANTKPNIRKKGLGRETKTVYATKHFL